jgi:hypothetical protein
VHIRAGSGTPYTLDAAATHCRISYPAGLKLSEQISKPDYKKIVGKIGETGRRTIYIRTDYGDVDVE